MSGQRIGYIRVSSVDQNLDRQLDGLELDRIFRDSVSGSTIDRQGLTSMLDHIREGDTVYVHDISRMARNTKHLLELVEVITSKGVTLEFLKESLTFTGDRSNPMNQLMLAMLGAVYEFERSMLLERQREGISKGKAKGKYKGRKSTIDKDKIMLLLSEGLSLTKTAKASGVSVSTVQRVKREMKAAKCEE